jgi:hypothetical protein
LSSAAFALDLPPVYVDESVSADSDDRNAFTDPQTGLEATDVDEAAELVGEPDEVDFELELQPATIDAVATAPRINVANDRLGSNMLLPSLAVDLSATSP